MIKLLNWLMGIAALMVLVACSSGGEGGAFSDRIDGSEYTTPALADAEDSAAHSDGGGVDSGAISEDVGERLIDSRLGVTDADAERAGIDSGPEVLDSAGQEQDVDGSLIPWDIVSDDAVGDGESDAEAAVDAQDAVLTGDMGDDADTGPVPVSDLTVSIVAPEGGEVFEQGAPVILTGLVSDSLYSPPELIVQWVSNVDGELVVSVPGEDGTTTWTVDSLTPGEHVVTLSVTNPVGQSVSESVTFSVCAWQGPEDFDTNITGSAWKIYGDAYWDGGGWLEMTGTGLGKSGAIFNVDHEISAGDVQISFKIKSGGGTGGGADGFAMSVIKVDTVAELDGIVNHPTNGGCLGYAVANCPQSGPNLQIEAFHVEFDTYHNVNNPITDPTPQNHIGVMLNGDAGTHYLWNAIPAASDIEDLTWHDVTIVVDGIHVEVTLDGDAVIDGVIPDLDFRGGFIGFSGTTGASTNYHSFDDLAVIQECVTQP